MDLPNVPISVGELFDKYSILEIKKEKIVNPEKRKKVVTEINYLNNIINKFKLNPELYNKLKFINTELWDIEDNIRIKEKNKEFDSEFINLARSVYITNDKRAKIKQEINHLFNSNIEEVKDYVKY